MSPYVIYMTTYDQTLLYPLSFPRSRLQGTWKQNGRPKQKPLVDAALPFVAARGAVPPRILLR